MQNQRKAEKPSRRFVGEKISFSFNVNSGLFSVILRSVAFLFRRISDHWLTFGNKNQKLTISSTRAMFLTILNGAYFSGSSSHHTSRNQMNKHSGNSSLVIHVYMVSNFSNQNIQQIKKTFFVPAVVKCAKK